MKRPNNLELLKLKLDEDGSPVSIEPRARVVRLLRARARQDEAARRVETDFGRHILPLATATHRVFAYDFAGNRVPGILPHEERNYWRDVGTIEAYRAAQRDASGPRPKFSLANERWPIGSNLRGGVVEHVAAAH